MPQIKWWGWLWDESIDLYSYIPWAEPVESVSKRTFPSWADIKFTHMEYEKNMLDHQWLQYAFIWFDELTHFTKKQFFYLLSRNRSTCWIKPYVRATCNPDPESWVKEFIEWYLDEDWYVIRERDGVIRYFTIDQNNVIRWDTKDEVIEQCPHLLEFDNPHDIVKSFAFIEWDLDENQALLSKDPTYKANLMWQDEDIKQALLKKCRNAVRDNNSLMDYQMINCITSNYVDSGEKCISIDVAWYGKDLAVQKTWYWNHCKRIKIFTKSSPDVLKESIEQERKNEQIAANKVIYDADGMWWGISWKSYIPFKWDNPPVEVDGVKESYPNLKTQLYYHLWKDVNEWKISYMDVEIFVDWVRTDTIKFKQKTESVIDLIKQDLRAIKRGKTDAEFKKHINSKAEQKNILGRSPDFWDTCMMKKRFDLNKSKTFEVYFL